MDQPKQKKVWIDEDVIDSPCCMFTLFSQISRPSIAPEIINNTGFFFFCPTVHQLTDVRMVCYALLCLPVDAKPQKFAVEHPLAS